MTTLATLIVRITADTTDYQTKLKAVSEMGKKISDVGGKLTKAVTLPLVAIGAFSVKAAADLADMRGKVETIFGKSSKLVEDFGKTAATSFGLSNRAADEATSTFGAMFTNMGLGTGAAAKMSVGMVGLAADMAEFRGEDPSAMLESLQGALTGRGMDLKKFGLDLSDATVQAKAMAMGIGDATGKLTEAQAVQVRYALIMEQTAKIQGTFAASTGDMGPKLEVMKAKLENAAAALGEKLLPFAIKAVDFITRLIDAFSNLSPATQNTIVTIAALAAATGPVLTIFGKLLQVGPGLIGFFTKLAPMIAANIAVLGPLILALTAVVAVGLAINDLNKKTEAGVKQVKTAWGDYFKQQISQGKTATEIANAYNQKTGEVNKTFNHQDDLLGKVAVGWIKLTQDESKFLGDQDGLQQALLQTTQSADEYWQSIVRASGGNEEFANSSSWMIQILKDKSEADYNAANGIIANTDATTTLTSTVGNYTDSITMAYNAQQALTSANIATVTSLEAEKTAALEAASSIRDNLAGAVQALQTAQQNWNLSVAGSAVSAIQATKGLSDEQIRILKAATDSALGSTYTATDNMNAALASAVADFKATGDVAQYEADVQKIADDFETTLAPDVKKAQDAVDNLQHALDLLNNVPINIPVTVTVSYPNGGIPGASGTTTPGSTPAPTYTQPKPAEEYATGGSGIVPAGYPNDSYLVGLTSGESFTVTPPGGATGSGVVINQYFSGRTDPEVVRIAARDGVLAAQRAKGKR